VDIGLKKRILFTIVLVLFFGATHAYAKEYQAKKRVGDWEVEIRMDRDPPIMGDNTIKIQIRDGEGKLVKDAKVLVNYYMPPMPRMAPMNFRTDANLKGDQFQATLRFIMEGPWYVVVILQREGKHSSMKFNVQVP
jgi:hypothetical protein